MNTDPFKEYIKQSEPSKREKGYRITKILSEKAFSFTQNEYISIHKKMFAGIYGHVGKMRDYSSSCKLCIKIMADTCIRGRKYTNYSSILY